MDQAGISLMDNSISSYHRRCFEDFLQVLSALRSHSHRFQQDISFTNVSNEFDRYKLWCSNVGAAHDGPTYRLSLDYRLREAPSYKKQISDILGRLAQTLERTVSLLEGKSQPFESQTLLDDSVESILDADSCSSGEENDDSSELELSSQVENNDFTQQLVRIRNMVANTDLEALQVVVKPPIDSQSLIESKSPISEVPQLLQTLRFTVNCLYRIPIRRPATYDRTKRLAGNDLGYFEPFDNSYIEDKCPAASPALKQRLQRMISRRRRLLHYRSKHYEKIKFELPRSATEATAKSKPLILANNFESMETARLSATTASEKQSSKPSQLSKATTFDPADFPPFSANLLSSENMSVAESLPSTNPSLWTGNQKLYIPPRPKGLAGGGGFICPYCFVLCQMKSDQAWKRHVLKDLEPYICTFINCDLEDHQFENRNDWYEHELQNHRLEWCCNLDGHTPCMSPSEFLLHLQEHHPDLQSSSLSQDTIRRFQRPAQKGLKICPLCSKPSEKLKSHLSRHMEQMALYVLGGNNQEDSESAADASDRAQRVGSSADLGSEDHSVGWERQHVPGISESPSPQDDIFDEQSIVLDATEVSWAVPFDIIGSLNLTTALILFLNEATEIVSDQVIYPLNIPPYYTGVQQTLINLERDGPIISVELDIDMKEYNNLGCLTQIEQDLGVICDQALDLCQDLKIHGIKIEITSYEALRRYLVDFRSWLVQKELMVEFTTRVQTLRFRLQTNVLDPFFKALRLSDWKPEDTIQDRVAVALYRDLKSLGPESFLGTYPLGLPGS